MVRATSSHGGQQHGPKDNETRTFGVREQWLEAIAEHISSRGLGRDDVLFAAAESSRPPILADRTDRSAQRTKRLDVLPQV
jgi:hypothetical protein